VSTSLAGRRVVVVGASAGIGRSFAQLAIAAGADTVLVARRRERLDEVVDQAGAGTVVVADVAADLAPLADALAAGPPVDLVLFAAGSSPLRRVADITAADWDDVLRANVVGFNQTLRAALPSLSPTAVVAALSSESTRQPRQALTGYAASKAALEASIRGWRLEHPGRRFCCVQVGATQPTEFGDAFDLELLGPVLDQWIGHGLMQQEFMHTDDVAAVLLDTLSVVVAHPGVCIEDLVLRSPSAVLAPTQSGLEAAAAASGHGATG
jgi:NAD(P)-dependent dehydrogenase (short-subunit alcohol dehydrogenase family)